MMTLILFLIVLAVLILVHELGHFYAAKRFGVRVDEFGLGFPPRAWGKKIGETIYSINWIPFGGFVKIFGESPDDESIKGADSPRSFVNRPRWMQVVILAAGVFMNVAFAWLLFSIAFMSGMTTSVSDSNERYIEDARVIVLDVLPDAPAARAGLVQGDQIVSFRLTGGATTSASTVESIQGAIAASGGAPVAFEVDRLTERRYIEVMPEEGILGDKPAIGISMDLVGSVELPVHQALWEGAKLTGRMFVGIVYGIYTLIADALAGNGDLSQVSGPVGIARLVGDAGKLGFVYLLSFTAFISLNLAVLNLIPFPALDGGRIVMVVVEAIRRKAIPPIVANSINAIGFSVLILFMLFITYKDIVKLL